MKCKACPYFDREHFDAYGEAICKEGDMVIRLRTGQGSPDDCPLKKYHHVDLKDAKCFSSVGQFADNPTLESAT